MIKWVGYIRQQPKPYNRYYNLNRLIEKLCFQAVEIIGFWPLFIETEKVCLGPYYCLS